MRWRSSRLLDKSGTPLIGPSTGAMSLHKPVQKLVFNVRSTYQREAEKAVQHLHTVGMQRIAVVQADDSFGKDAMEGAMKGFDKAGLKPVVLALADRNKPDYATIVPKLTAANAQAVLWIGSGTAVTEGIKALRAAGSAAQVITLSNNAASGFIKELGNASGGVIVMQVLPSERAMAHPLIKEASDLAKAKGDIELSPALLEGFVATKVMVEALRRAGPKPTRAKLLAVLNDFRYDVGRRAGGGLLAAGPHGHRLRRSVDHQRGAVQALSCSRRVIPTRQPASSTSCAAPHAAHAGTAPPPPHAPPAPCRRRPGPRSCGPA